MLTVVDYGMGNLRSVEKAFAHLGAEVRVAVRPEEADNAEKLVLPGVGAFADAMAQLRNAGWIEPIRAHIAADKPFLGICLGLQLLFDVSLEDGRHEGLGVFAGEVVHFPPGPLKIPHMGWNTLSITRPNALTAELPDNPMVYFVHSYYVVPSDPSIIAARTTHGVEFVSMACRGNVFATQFHPEKSQGVGMNMLRHFVEL